MAYADKNNMKGLVSKLKTYIDSKLKKNLDDALDTFYPIGCIYQSFNSTPPEQLFGGTWQEIGKGQVLIGVDENQTDFNDVKKSGGSSSHRHDFRIGMYWYYGAACGENGSYGGAYKYSNGTYNGWTDALSNATVNKNGNVTNSYGGMEMSGRYSTGDTSSASSLPPYITCYRWARIA